MAFMIMVNNNGGERAADVQLHHSEWRGWTLTETVFPSFVGIAVYAFPHFSLSPGVYFRAAVGG